MMTTIATAAGLVNGRHVGDALSFPGIPYAQAPVGERRFAAPAPVTSVSPVVNAQATAEIVAPPQLPSPFAEFLGDPQNTTSEDCLHLNVWTPRDHSGDLPVLVFFHGGSYMIGDARLPRYDGAELAAEQGIVVVTVNYRVGLLGFAPAPGAVEAPIDITDDDLDFGTGTTPVLNAGFLDMVAALHWVRQNIARFGGNPDAVTVSGQSAGGHAAIALLGHPDIRTLFSRVVLQSAPVAMPGMSTSESLDLQATVADHLGGDSLADFRAASVDSLLQAQRAIATRPRRLGDVIPPIRLVESSYTPVTVTEAITDQDLSGVAVLGGINHDECNFFFSFDPMAKGASEEDLAVLCASHGREEPTHDLDAYRVEYGSAPEQLVSAIQTERYFARPLVEFTERLARQGADAHRYILSFRPSGDYSMLGACHTIELAFLLGGPDSRTAPWLVSEDPAALRRLRTECRGVWGRFIRNDDIAIDDPTGLLTLATPAGVDALT